MITENYVAMARIRHLPHAPITEALIDIQVAPRPEADFNTLKERFNEAQFGYYVKGPIAENVVGLKIESDGSAPQTTASATQVGLRLHSNDEKYVAQCRLKGFTLSRLAPYEDWSNLVNETKRVWAIYQDLLNPLKINRIATRYINNLKLPLNHGDSFQKYLVKLADVPDESPQGLANFFQRFELADAGSSSRVLLTASLQNHNPGDPVPVLLDIDASQLVDFDPLDPTLWPNLDELRDLKNRVFFSTITDEAAALYE